MNLFFARIKEDFSFFLMGFAIVTRMGSRVGKWYRQGHQLVKGIETLVSCCFKSFSFDEVFVVSHIVINILAPCFFFNSQIFLDP